MRHVGETNLLRKTDFDAVMSLSQLKTELVEDETPTVFSAVKLSGDRNCTVALILPEELALLIARDLLHYDPSQLDFGAGMPIYRDAAGELNNMVAGTFKSALSRSDIQCRLSPPIIINGPDSLLRALSKAAELLVARFRLEEFNVRICLWT